MLQSDFHIHTEFSADSTADMERMVQKGIALGLKTMCLTDHMDYDFTPPYKQHILDTPAYRERILALRERYADRIELLFGVELGLQPHLSAQHKKYVADFPFDFIIGSTHMVDQMDIYYPDFFVGRTDRQYYGEYLETTLENIRTFSDFSVYGHLDYIVRYSPDKGEAFSYRLYAEQIDAILHALIEKGCGIELNTSGFKYGLPNPNPHPDIIRRYRELGGEMITVGSDAHQEIHLAYGFSRVPDILKACGFSYYTEFRNRKPVFVKID